MKIKSVKNIGSYMYIGSMNPIVPYPIKDKIKRNELLEKTPQTFHNQLWYFFSYLENC